LEALRQQASVLLDNATNYACELRISRTVDKQSAGQKMEEEARLEVAYIADRERFSWPGAATFGDDELREVLVMGLSGSGSFAEHLRTVVGGADTAFGQPRRESQDGRNLLHIPYEVPATRSGYLVNLDGTEIQAAIEGEISVLEDGMEIVGFSLAAKDLPAGFPATAVAETIQYQPPGESSLRLPASATQRMVEGGTDVYDNRFGFEACRRFQSESEVRFTGEPATPAGNDTPPDHPSALEDGIPFELELKTAITWDKTITGDTIEGLLTRPVKWKGEVLANSGATVLGRVVEFKRITGGSAVGYFVGLQFYSIEDKGKTLPLRATLEALTDMPKSARRGLAAMVRGDTIPFEVMNRLRSDGKPYPNAGFVRVLADTKGLPSGFAMRWVSGAENRRERMP
jgi:hypothetical protein